MILHACLDIRGPLGTQCNFTWHLLWSTNNLPGSSGAAKAPYHSVVHCRVLTKRMSTTTSRVSTSAASEHWLLCSTSPQSRNSTPYRPLIRSILVFSVARSDDVDENMKEKIV